MPPAIRAGGSLNMNRIGQYLTDPALDPPVRVLFVQGSNPAATAPNQRLVQDGLRRDDLFTVVHDQVCTDTACFADVVLPATTHFESTDVAASYGSYVFAEVPAVIDRVGESRTDNEVSAALAARLGFDPAKFDPDPAALVAAWSKAARWRGCRSCATRARPSSSATRSPRHPRGGCAWPGSTRSTSRSTARSTRRVPARARHARVAPHDHLDVR